MLSFSMVTHIIGFVAIVFIPLALAGYGGHLAALTFEEKKKRTAQVIVWTLALIGILLGALQQYLIKKENDIQQKNHETVAAKLNDELHRSNLNAEFIKGKLSTISEFMGNLSRTSADPYIKELASAIEKTSRAVRIITLKQKQKIRDALKDNPGNISIFYVLGDAQAKQYAEEIRDVFNDAYWKTTIDGVNFAGFNKGLILSYKTDYTLGEMFPKGAFPEGYMPLGPHEVKAKVIIKAFDSGDIAIKTATDSSIKEGGFELNVGRP